MCDKENPNENPGTQSLSSSTRGSAEVSSSKTKNHYRLKWAISGFRPEEGKKQLLRTVCFDL